MKRLFTIFTILTAVMLVSSCQKELPDNLKNIDVSQGNQEPSHTPDNGNQQNESDINPNVNQSLEGTWKGNMYISSSYDGRSYDATYTEITFLKDPYAYSSGNGYWVDYYRDAPWGYIANHIDWKVDFGTININFVEEGTSMKISDYHLNNDRFYGRIDDGGNSVEFELYHTSTPNWSSYQWGYDPWLNYY